MKKTDIIIKNDTDLHSRSASIFVKEAARYISEIKILKDGSEYDGKSILGILSLGAAKGDKLTITARGEDEEAAIEALQKVLDNNFDI